jgi:predicted DNA-binding transcriptional regulator YafY
VVAVLRKVTAAPFGNIRVDPATTMLQLQRAIRDEDTLLIGYLDPAGVATQRVVSPLVLRGGQLVGFDSASGRMRDFAIHRITSVVSADEG